MTMRGTRVSLDVTVKVPVDLDRFRLPRWRRAVYDLQHAKPYERVRLMGVLMTKVFMEVVLVVGRSILFNPLCLRLWVWLLKGRVEFFGNSHTFGDMPVSTDYYLLRRLSRRSRIIAVYLANTPYIANYYLAQFQAKALGSRRILFVLNRFLCRLLEPLRQPLFFAGPYTFLTFSHSPPDYNELIPRYNLHLERKMPSSERQWARELMERVGLPRTAKFVTVHVREAGFKAHFHVDGHNTFRDADIDTYVPAIQYVTQQGLWVVRMGESTVKPLPSMERVIDYARSSLKSDFLDVVLLSECEFLICCPSGLSMMAHVFNKPLLYANAILLYGLPYRPSARWIPKLLFNRAEERYVTLAEIFHRGIGEFAHSQDYVAAGLEVHDNSPEDILEATQELYHLYRGELRDSEEERGVQQAVRQLFPPHYMSHGAQALLCASFIRRHRALMPQVLMTPTHSWQPAG